MLTSEDTLGRISQSMFPLHCTRLLASICLMTNAVVRHSESLRPSIHVSHHCNQRANQNSFTAASGGLQISLKQSKSGEGSLFLHNSVFISCRYATCLRNNSSQDGTCMLLEDIRTEHGEIQSQCYLSVS